jgi:hypothetical protein
MGSVVDDVLALLEHQATGELTAFWSHFLDAIVLDQDKTAPGPEIRSGGQGARRPDASDRGRVPVLNPAQGCLVRLLTGPRVEPCVDGDDDQAITVARLGCLQHRGVHRPVSRGARVQDHREPGSRPCTAAAAA